MPLERAKDYMLIPNRSIMIRYTAGIYTFLDRLASILTYICSWDTVSYFGASLNQNLMVYLDFSSAHFILSSPCTHLSSMHKLLMPTSMVTAKTVGCQNVVPTISLVGPKEVGTARSF